MKFSAPTEPMKFESGKKYKAVINTSKGKIVCELRPDKAPLTVTNFINLAKGDFYKGLKFHRVIANFMIQGGDPEGTGRGGPGYQLPAEIGLPHTKGALATARLGDAVNPEKKSSGSQFYITHGVTPHLDNEYTVFGQTIEGQDVVDKIQMGDTITNIEIVVE